MDRILHSTQALIIENNYSISSNPTQELMITNYIEKHARSFLLLLPRTRLIQIHACMHLDLHLSHWSIGHPGAEIPAAVGQ